MLFNSYVFAVFFAIVLALYWSLARFRTVQNGLLLVASYIFYGWWDIRFLYLIVMTTAADYCYGLMIGKGFIDAKQRRSVSLLMILSALVFVTIRWSAIDASFSGGSPDFRIDWFKLIPGEWSGWWYFYATAIVVAAANVLYPWFATFSEQRRRDWFMIASLATNLTTLGFFKYYNFFAESFRELVSTFIGVTPSSWTLNIVLPVGVSFFTFQSLSYTIDVYKRRIPPETSLNIILTCLAFFPQLVAGPIERAAHLLPQFHRSRSISIADWNSGVWLVVWGLFQKLVVADNAAVIVNRVFRPFDAGAPFPEVPEDGLRVLIAVYAFALQIFGDFSGYSDIARGTARLLGFDIMLNFNLPYFAISPSDFWRRWHISLSTWLRDYLYIPLGGNRGGKLKTYRNLFLTMLLGGLWHGASWTYVLWGAFHGLILIMYQFLTSDIFARTPKPTDITVNGQTTSLGASPISMSIGSLIGSLVAGIVMFHLTCLGWLMFRAQNVTTIGLFAQSLAFHPNWSSEASELGLSLISCGWFLILFQLIQASRGTTEPMANLPWFLRLNTWAFVLMSLLTLSAETEQTFIYFAF